MNYSKKKIKGEIVLLVRLKTSVGGNFEIFIQKTKGGQKFYYGGSNGGWQKIIISMAKNNNFGK